MVAIVVIACLVALVWGSYAILRGSLVAACMAYLITSSCLGFDFWHFDVCGISLSLDRILLVAIVAGFFVRWRLGRLPATTTPISDVLLAAFTLLLIASTFMHDWRADFPGNVPIVQHLINGYLIPVVLYWMARRAEINQRHVATVCCVLVGFGIYLVATSFFEVLGMWSLVFPKYISDPDMGIHFGRARGPFLQSVRLGTFLILCLIATWLYLIRDSRWGRFGIVLATVLTPLYLAAIYLTYTRSVWLSTIVAVLVVLILAIQETRRRLVIIGATIAATLLVAVLQWENVVSLKREQSAAETRQSTYMRASFAYVSWLMFKQQPALGHGFGQYPSANRPFLSDRSTPLRLESIRGYMHHNTFLCVLVELGIVGFLLFVILLARWSSAAIRLWRDPGADDWARTLGLLFVAFAAAYCVQMVFHDVTHSPVENGCLFFLAGITCRLATARQPTTCPTPRQRVPYEPAFARSRL